MKRPGQPPHTISCTKSHVKLRLKLGGFESHSNTTKPNRGFPSVEFPFNFPFLTPASKLASCKLEPFSRVFPVLHPRNAAWLEVAMCSLVGSVTSQATIHQ